MASCILEKLIDYKHRSQCQVFKSWLYIPINDLNEAEQIQKILNADEWFNTLLIMQDVNLNFKRSMVQYFRTKIIELKMSNKPLTSVNFNFINRIAEKHQKSHKTSQEYLADLSNFS